MIDLHWRLPVGTKVRAATLSVTGRPARKLGKRARSAMVDLRAPRRALSR